MKFDHSINLESDIRNIVSGIGILIIIVFRHIYIYNIHSYFYFYNLDLVSLENVEHILKIPLHFPHS